MSATPVRLSLAAACLIVLIPTGASAAESAARPSPPPAAETSPSHPPIDANSVRPAPKRAAKDNAAPRKKVDINNATLAELKTLPTMREADAKKIIAHRPYRSKGELVTKAGLPEGVFYAIRRHVELQAPRKAAAKK